MPHSEQDPVARLVTIMATLRSPEGCPWDAEQTPESLKPYLLEEAYELLEALDGGEAEPIREELGDLLLQVVFLARIFEEQGAFDLKDVARTIGDKLVRRHPHVFAELDETDQEALHRNWDRIKASEKAGRKQPQGLLAGLPSQLPALLRTQKALVKSARHGLPWPDATEQTQQLSENIDRLGSEDTIEDKQRQLGRILLGAVNLCRLHGIDAEDALRTTTGDFLTRFSDLEEQLHEKGLSLANAGEEQMATLRSEFEAQD